MSRTSEMTSLFMSENTIKKKIILVSHEMTYTGAPRSLLNICYILLKKQILIEVYTLKQGPFENEFNKLGIYVKKYTEESVYDMTSADIIILNTIFASHLCCVLKTKTKARVYLFVREAKNLNDLLINCSIDWTNISIADKVFCVSEYAEHYIRKYNPKNLVVIHNYVKDSIRSFFNYPKNGIIKFIVSGTYEERKGMDVAVKAFLQMPQELRDISKLYIVGSTPSECKEYQDGVRSLYDKNIIEYGEITDDEQRISFYDSMNVFLIPSKDEACSLVALEGAMLGKLIIMSENVGAKYLQKDKRWIFRTDDVEDLCRRMCNATSRRVLLQEGVKMRIAYNKTSTERIYEKNVMELIR